MALYRTLNARKTILEMARASRLEQLTAVVCNVFNDFALEIWVTKVMSFLCHYLVAHRYMIKKVFQDPPLFVLLFPCFTSNADECISTRQILFLCPDFWRPLRPIQFLLVLWESDRLIFASLCVDEVFQKCMLFCLLLGIASWCLEFFRERGDDVWLPVHLDHS